MLLANIKKTPINGRLIKILHLSYSGISNPTNLELPSLSWTFNKTALPFLLSTIFSKAETSLTFFLSASTIIKPLPKRWSSALLKLSTLEIQDSGINVEAFLILIT